MGKNTDMRSTAGSRSLDKKGQGWHSEESPRRARPEVKRSVVLWFTGLPASGKSTICRAVEERLRAAGCRTLFLDGDEIRRDLSRDLTFSLLDRRENMRRVGELLKLVKGDRLVALAAFISPLRAHREYIRSAVEAENFVEIYCKCPLEVCVERDRKGNYLRARAGTLKEFTGISSPYEESELPDLTLDTAALAVDACVEKVLVLPAVEKAIRDAAGKQNHVD